VATAELLEVEGRRLTFAVKAHDGVELIGEGIHRRFIINVPDFAQRVAVKAARHT